MNPSIPTYPNLGIAIKEVQNYLRVYGNHLQTESWQGMKQPPEFYEALNVSFSSYIPRSIHDLVEKVRPSLPWADAHFLERVGGEPLNPGHQYKEWPWYKNNKANDTSRVLNGQFSHTYMERIWPKFAGYKLDAYYQNYPDWKKTIQNPNDDGYKPHKGLRFEFADLTTLMEVLKKEPNTRQAFLPIWFPEDGEAALAGQRVPCTLGYHFIRRGQSLSITYYIRSCDFFRHFRDDIYLACMLVYHILKILSVNDKDNWAHIIPGYFSMHITSLHIWSKEYNLLKD